MLGIVSLIVSFIRLLGVDTTPNVYHQGSTHITSSRSSLEFRPVSSDKLGFLPNRSFYSRDVW
jgi:hypothetical protein